ncbi:unnamed protein product [Dicrocoelium dendriticum]|nr:unnamed protein product [Dicrocoelium dendriticum]
MTNPAPWHLVLVNVAMPLRAPPRLLHPHPPPRPRALDAPPRHSVPRATAPPGTARPRPRPAPNRPVFIAAPTRRLRSTPPKGQVERKPPVGDTPVARSLPTDLSASWGGNGSQSLQPAHTAPHRSPTPPCKRSLKPAYRPDSPVRTATATSRTSPAPRPPSHFDPPAPPPSLRSTHL